MTGFNSTLLAAEPFTQHRAFTLWRLDSHPTDPTRKPIKVPVHYDGVTRHDLGNDGRNGKPARPANPAPPLTATQAAGWLAHHHATRPETAQPGRVGYLGTGFRPEGTGLVCIDLDACVTATGWSPGALALMARFPGALVEQSVSGTGAHLWLTVRGLGPGRRGKQVTPLGDVEVYGAGQFLACGTVLGGDARVDHTEAVDRLVAEFWPAQRAAQGAASEWSDKTPDQQAAALADLRSALAVLDADNRDEWVAVGQALQGLGEEGYALWAEWSATSSRYPGGDGLDKWDGFSGERTGYGAVLARAEATGKWANPARRADPLSTFGASPLPAGALAERPAAAAAIVYTAPSGMVAREDPTATLIDQDRMFRGCTYVADAHRVLMPNGVMLKPEAFNAMKGGYTFYISAAGDKKTDKAFEALTQNRVLPFPRVDSTAFKPEYPFGHIVTHQERTAVNTYRPLGITPVEGDASPWLRLIEKQYPDARDRAILTAYMAACLRYPGRKWQWAVLLQGVQGSAKTLHSRVLAEGLGKQYVHELDPKKIGNQFNAFMRNRLLVTIEEINIPGNRHDLIDALKPLITNDRIEIEVKGSDAVTEDVCANFFLFTNRPDGLPASRNERRFAMLHMAQQEKEDLARDGLTEDYFRQLYDWLRAGGYAVVVHHLMHCEIDARYDPSGACVRAPETSSTERAIRESMGREEQFIQEAIDTNEQGFSGGWLSSRKVAALLQSKMGREPAPRLLGTIIRRLGYRPHPTLPDGRTDNAVTPDGTKTTLYILPGSEADTLTAEMTRVDVTKAYSAAQPANVFGGLGVNVPYFHNEPQPTVQ